MILQSFMKRAFNEHRVQFEAVLDWGNLNWEREFVCHLSRFLHDEERVKLLLGATNKHQKTENLLLAIVRNLVQVVPHLLYYFLSYMPLQTVLWKIWLRFVQLVVDAVVDFDWFDYVSERFHKFWEDFVGWICRRHCWNAGKIPESVKTDQAKLKHALKQMYGADGQTALVLHALEYNPVVFCTQVCVLKTVYHFWNLVGMEANPFKRTHPVKDEEEDVALEPESKKILCPSVEPEEHVDTALKSYGMVSLDGRVVKVGNKSVKCMNNEVAKGVLASLNLSHKEHKVADLEVAKLSKQENIDKNKRIFDVRTALRKHKDYSDSKLELGDGYMYKESRKTIKKPSAKEPAALDMDLKKQLEELKEQLKQYRQHDREFTKVEQEGSAEAVASQKKQLEELKKYMGLV